MPSNTERSPPIATFKTSMRGWLLTVRLTNFQPFASSMVALF